MAPSVLFKQRKVLICDDQAMLRELLEWAVRSRAPQYAVVQVDDGKAAEKVIRSDDSFDIIFLDVEMPEQDGITTIRRLREQRLANESSIVLCTGLSPEHASDLGWQLRTEFYLRKPFDLDDVNTVIDTIVGRNRDSQIKSRDNIPETQLASLANCTGFSK